MTDDIITISAGAPASDLTPGVYEVTLLDISEPRTIYPQTGPNAGKEVQLRDWTFALEDGTEVTGSACTASGPKSKTFAWLTALLGGTPPAVGPSTPSPSCSAARRSRRSRSTRAAGRRSPTSRPGRRRGHGAVAAPGRGPGPVGRGRAAVAVDDALPF